MRSSIWCLVALGILCFGCHRTEEKVSLQLNAFPIGESGRYRLVAEAHGPLNGVRYRFYADDGSCEPEISDRPESAFTPSPGAANESVQVTVEALRGDMPIQSAHYTIKLKGVASTRPEEPNAAQAPLNNLQPPTSRSPAIEITEIPHKDPIGGPNTREDIAGVVRGVSNPDAFRVVLYARTDFWYVQPLLGSTIEINPDGTWKSWTHTGSEYAALLVRQGYSPSSTLGTLPSKDIIAVTSKMGTR
jgi:hypothetical protein